MFSVHVYFSCYVFTGFMIFSGDTILQQFFVIFDFDLVEIVILSAGAYRTIDVSIAFALFASWAWKGFETRLKFTEWAI